MITSMKAPGFVRALALGGLWLVAASCADKGAPPTGMRFNGKLALQVTTTATQTVNTAPQWVMVVVLSEFPDRDNNNNNGNGGGDIVLGHTYARFTNGTQTIPVAADLAPCGRGGATQIIVAAALVPDTVAFPNFCTADSVDFDPVSHAVDVVFSAPIPLGASRSVVVPTLELSQSKFAATYWLDDEALRIGGANGITELSSAGFIPGNARMAAASGAGGLLTYFTLGQGNDPSTQAANDPTPRSYPQLGVYENGNWRRFTATTAPNLATPGQQPFNAVTAVASNEAYMSAGYGLFRWDGTAISKVAAVTDSTFSVASVVTASNQKLIIAGTNGGAWIGNGTTFQRYSIPTTSRVDGVCITGPNEAFASTWNGGGLFRFDGTSWSSVPASLNGSKLDLQCPAPGQAFVLVSNTPNGLLRWTGTAWTNIPTTGLSAGRFIRWGVVSPTEIYSYADSTPNFQDRVFHRFNGTSWVEIGRTRGAEGGGAMWATSGAAYVASRLSRIERATPTGVSPVSYAPSIFDVSVSSASNAFAVGDLGFLARWNGTKWNVDAPPAGAGARRPLTGVWTDGPNRAWAVGVANSIFRWDGTVWNKVSDSLSAVTPVDNYWGVWGSGADAWIVGDNTIVHCKVAASCTVEANGGGALLGIWGSGPTDIYAAGDGGRMMHFNGTAWTSMPSGTTRRLAKISGSSASNVWAVGDSVMLRLAGGQWTVNRITGRSDDDDFNDLMSYVASSAERRPTQNTGPVPYRMMYTLGLFVRTPTDIYVGSERGQIGRWNGERWDEAYGDSDPGGRRRVMAISGTPAGCLLAVRHQTYAGPDANLQRGTGPSNCFAAPMGPAANWP